VIFGKLVPDAILTKSVESVSDKDAYAEHE
jgi:hypothetical protein